MAAAPDFVARTYCPFCQALQPLRFAACPRYTCGDCEGIRDAEVCAVCAKCTFEFCPNCVQVPSVECGGHQAELVEEKTNLRCVECGKQCQEGKDTAHSRCGKCGKCQPPVAAVEPSTTPVAAGPTSEPSSAAPPAWQTVTFLSSRASKRLPPVLVGPTTTILDALDATATLPRTLINAWRRGEELTRPVFWIEKKGDKVMLPESLPVSVVAAGAGEIEIQFAAKAADRGDLHEFSI